jgi:hypothetical protein
MKKNDYLLLTATGAYSFLFYQQNAGINFLIFNLVFILVLLARNKNLLSSKKWCWSALLTIISSACIFIHSSSLSILANIFSLILLSGLTFNTVSSSLFAYLFAIYSIITSPVYMIIDAVNRTHNNVKSESNPKGYKIISGFIVLFLTLIFFAMYKAANPLFAENTKWINLDFLSFGWIAFTIGGFILVYALYYHKTIAMIENWENGLSIHNFNANNNLKHKQYEAERFAGMLLFMILNTMLLVLNVGDVNTLYFLGCLPKGITHSDFVHNGVGVIIFSIMIATALIMYLFRMEFDGVKHNGLFKTLAIIWIIQNIIMLSSTAVRNQMYIHTYDFTYKRIGVYVWLILASIGLVIMYIKLRQNRSNWYLIKSNVAVWFSVLVFSACFNWDKIITQYNIDNKPYAQIDFSYLFSLSEANIPQLIKLLSDKDFKVLLQKEKRLNHQLKTELKHRNQYSRSRYEQLENELNGFHHLWYEGQAFEEALHNKIANYLKEYKSDWRSYDLRDREIVNCIINR